MKVAEPAQLMDFLIAKMGGMAKSSVKQLLGQRRVKVGNAVQTRHDFALKPGDIVTVSSGSLTLSVADIWPCVDVVAG